MTYRLWTKFHEMRFHEAMELRIPDGTFSMSDLEQANGHLGPIAVRTQFVRAIVEGHVEVVETPGAEVKTFTYRKSDGKR